MPIKAALASLCLGLALGTCGLATGASAAIKCYGIFQRNQFGSFVSPYCSDQEIARVARIYGEKVTGEQVGNNPLLKVQLCQTYGGDIRLKGACAGYAPENYNLR